MACLRSSNNYVWNTNEFLGRGATCDVYKGRQKRNGAEVAVKVFNFDGRMRSKLVQDRELEVLKRLKHRNIVRVLDFEEEKTSGAMVIVMELCSGGSLYQVLEEPTHAFGLTEDEFLKVLDHVYSGMKHLRELDIVHRDIKPANIMRYLDEDGSSIYKLTDFGAARELPQDEAFMSLYGTEEYLHPDLYQRAVLRIPAGKQFNATVDLWSLGVTLYHAATGRLPFRPYGGRRNKETMYEITTKKRSGVISGVQECERGPITWDNKLPEDIKLSKGLKRIITPLIAGLVECDQEKQWGFDQFFMQAEQVATVKDVLVFCVSSMEMMHIYVEEIAVLNKVQDLIYRQCGMVPEEQVLIYRKQLLTDVLSEDTMVKDWTMVKNKKPIFLFPSDPKRMPALHGISIDAFPNIASGPSAATDVDGDHFVAKKCLGITHDMCYKVDKMIEEFWLLENAVTSYWQVLQAQEMAVMKQELAAQDLAEAVKSRAQLFISNHEIHAKALSMLSRHNKEVQSLVEATQGDLSQILDTRESAELRFEDKLRLRRENHANFRKLDDIRTLRDCWGEDMVTNTVRQGRWKEKIEVLLTSVEEVFRDFTEDRRRAGRARLPYSEEQIHKFQKAKLQDKIVKINSVFDHCGDALVRLRGTFEVWFSNLHPYIHKLQQKMEKLHEMEAEVQMYTSMLNKDVAKYDKYIRDLLGQVDQCIQKAVEHEDQSQQQKASNKAEQRKKAQGVKLINEGLQGLTKETTELKELISENTSLLKQLEDLSLTADNDSSPDGNIDGFEIVPEASQ